ncbi:uncharacterized protein MYCGRDRAFT_94394 [Zymoseptoria tritici IPO323]|uniref:Rhodopsin domain-containing protein n=1 Tax=Zymoseptoria tritici (strain CBS 115943 / IPO323) TaxID=336722 RepID=F9XFD9_ZYMTI|nr:uncharacterized protein MYCGRDRAFT_94394 [Zymoseptoria tritici IPO323]EGP86179.1 hypothetical protein MYCGRDRAFT_94394 [Zymoseptoria tritici IPO323]
MLLINEASVIALTSILTVLATLAVALRLLKADRGDTLLHRWKIDDYFCVAALVLAYPIAGIIIWGAAMGSVGGHSGPAEAETWYTTAGPAWVVMGKVFWVTFFLQPLVLGCVRLAILFLYRRFFASYQSFNIVSWILIGVVAGWTLAFFFGLLFDCGLQFDANWKSLGEIAEQCPFGFLPTIIYTILDACLDLFVLVLPIPWIFVLKLSTSKKLSLAGCFLLGGIATAAAFVRMTIFIQTSIPSQMMNRTSVMGLPIYDILGIVGNEVFWTMIETTIALIAVCLPAIRRIVLSSRFRKSLGLGVLSRMTRTSRSKSNGSKDASDVERSAGASSAASSRTLFGIKREPHVTIDSFKSLHCQTQLDRIGTEEEKA